MVHEYFMTKKTLLINHCKIRIIWFELNAWMLVSLWLKLNNELTSLDQCVHGNSVVSSGFGRNMINLKF